MPALSRKQVCPVNTNGRRVNIYNELVSTNTNEREEDFEQPPTPIVGRGNDMYSAVYNLQDEVEREMYQLNRKISNQIIQGHEVHHGIDQNGLR